MRLPIPSLRAPRLTLRPFVDADTDALYALHSSSRVLRYWDAPPWKDRERATRFIAACREMEGDGSGARFAIEHAGAFVGWCGLKLIPEFRSATMVYCFNEAAWGKGFATEAAEAMLRWAFETVDLNRVQSEADTRNAASARVLEKLGFLREGTLRENCIVDGDVSDSWVYGLLWRDWESR